MATWSNHCEQQKTCNFYLFWHKMETRFRTSDLKPSDGDLIAELCELWRTCEEPLHGILILSSSELKTYRTKAENYNDLGKMATERRIPPNCDLSELLFCIKMQELAITCIFRNMLAYMHICLNIYVYLLACLHRCEHICIYAYMHICWHICIYSSIYAYLLRYMHICQHICIYTYIYIYIY